jgi:AcrR family transcriptional regulator
MPNEESLTLADIERETDRFLMPATEKEADILRAAVNLLGERGVDGATTAEIAKRAGVTERTLFRYFPSKRDLVRRVLAPTILRTILTREWRPFRALLDGSAADGGERPMFVFPSASQASPPIRPSRGLCSANSRNAELRNPCPTLAPAFLEPYAHDRQTAQDQRRAAEGRRSRGAGLGHRLPQHRLSVSPQHSCRRPQVGRCKKSSRRWPTYCSAGAPPRRLRSAARSKYGSA